MNPQAPSPEREEPILITPDMLAEGSRGAGVDFERGMHGAPPLTIALILVNGAVFAWELATGALESDRAILAAGALAYDPVFAGQVWRLATAPFLHGGVDHLLGNCIVLYILGMACEHGFGLARTALIYGASALSGSYLSVLVNPGPSVGASGAVFGVMAAVIAMLYRHQRVFHIRDKRIGFVLLVWGAYQVATGFLSPWIDNVAHIGGALGGGLAALRLRPRLLPGPEAG